jgi:hypothetical protein
MVKEDALETERIKKQKRFKVLTPDIQKYGNLLQTTID